jgi:hypothetical protein
MPQALLRACLATGLAALVALAAARPHVHEAAIPGHGEAPCAVCQLRSVEPATDPAPDLAPAVVCGSDLLLPPGLPPVSGAPLGAVPGQSPPAAA